MGMAFVSRLRRPLGLLLLPVVLAACSGGLTPPDDIDGADVGAIRPERRIARPFAMEIGDTGGDLPNYSSAGVEAMPAAAQQKRLPMIDSDEAMGIAEPVQASAGALSVPEGGVSMDEPHLALYAVGAYVLLLAAAVSAFDAHSLWRRVEELRA